jgi:Putative peptidoglycan binding domain
MRIFFVLICSFALVWIAGAQPPPEKKGEPKKKGAHAGQISQPPGHAVGKPTTTAKPTTTGKPAEVGKPSGAAKSTATKEQMQGATAIEKAHKPGAGKAKAAAKPTEVGKPAEVGKAAGAGKTKATAKPTEVGKPAEVGKAAGATKTTTAGKTIKPQHFDVPKQPNTAKAPPVKFQQGRHIEGSQNWQGEQYAVFRNYHSEWHDQGWWHSHYGNNIVFMFGAPYFLNAGYWYPAWGYSPNAYYAWDGPVPAYNNLPPDQVIANVQSALQQQGYYHDEVDGLLGPETRGALAAYQRDHGLAETAAVDQPTLESLGMT